MVFWTWLVIAVSATAAVGLSLVRHPLSALRALRKQRYSRRPVEQRTAVDRSPAGARHAPGYTRRCGRGQDCPDESWTHNPGRNASAECCVSTLGPRRQSNTVMCVLE